MSALRRLLRTITTKARRFARDRRGNVAIISALALPALMGAFGLGTEVASWYANQRLMQNAADSAALAAATNAGSNYDVEAKAVTAKYGFADGQKGVAVAVSNTAPCPAGGSDCYSVSITRSMPLVLAQFVGFNGDATLAGAPAKRINALAVASRDTVPRPYCLVALGQKGTSILTHGAPFADMSGCNLMSNGDATCTGHDLGADNGDAHGRNNGCGVVRHENLPVMADPYSGLASNIRPDDCKTKYPAEPYAHEVKKVALRPDNVFDTNQSLDKAKPICGDLQLTRDVTITNTNGPTQLVIYNGDLDLNGHTLSTADGSAVTVVFAGDNGYSHKMIGGGGLDIQAPKDGPFKNMAIYADPKITDTSTDMAAAGNSPTWDISGIVYLPHSSVTLSGAVNKSSNGDSCFVLVADNVTINGTGSILAHGGCAAGEQPTNPVPGRGKLVS